MTKVTVDYLNFNPKLHKKFPIIKSCKVYSKDNIFNVDILANRDILNVSDDIGFDIKGKYYFISYGQWHDHFTGEYISTEDFYNLEESEYVKYEFVSFIVKIYLKGNYYISYKESSGKKLKVSFINNAILNFKDTESDTIFKL